MIRLLLLILGAAAALTALAACTPIARDPACDAADACDQALNAPFGDFVKDDPAFGDVGSCWQSTA